jgi:hypothetical protein
MANGRLEMAERLSFDDEDSGRHLQEGSLSRELIGVRSSGAVTKTGEPNKLVLVENSSEVR